MRRAEPEPATAYEVRFRLEGSYRRHGYGFLAFGLVGFVLAVLAGEPWLFLFTGPAMFAGLFLIFRDPREYLVVEPRRRHLRLIRVYGRHERVRRDYPLRQFARLETAQYDARPKGLRCMILLFRANGTVEKVDDRLHDPLLPQVCADVARQAGLEFIDRGRIDVEPLAELDGHRGETAVDRQEAAGDEAAGAVRGE